MSLIPQYIHQNTSKTVIRYIWIRVWAAPEITTGNGWLRGRPIWWLPTNLVTIGAPNMIPIYRNVRPVPRRVAAFSCIRTRWADTMWIIRNFHHALCDRYGKFYRPNRAVVFPNRRSHFAAICVWRAMNNAMPDFLAPKTTTHAVIKIVNCVGVRVPFAGKHFNTNACNTKTTGPYGTRC